MRKVSWGSRLVAAVASFLQPFPTRTILACAIAYAFSWQILYILFVSMELPVPPGLSNFIRPSIHLDHLIPTLTKHNSNLSNISNSTNGTTSSTSSANRQEDGTILGLQSSILEDPSVDMVQNGNPVSPNRAERFPTVEERVKLYMSNWYTPLCDDATDEKFQYPPNLNVSLCLVETEFLKRGESSRDLAFFSTITSNVVFFINSLKRLEDCAAQPIGNMGRYCADVLDLYKKIRAISSASSSFSPPPLLLQFGDGSTSQTQGIAQVPHFAKIRPAAFQELNSRTEIERVTSIAESCLPEMELRSPLNTGKAINRQVRIIWNLNSERFFGRVYDVPASDTDWSEKQNVAVFRGALTGCNRPNFAPKINSYDPTNITVDDCKSIMRCRLVLTYGQSKFIDAKFVTSKFYTPYGKGLLPERLDDAVMVGSRMSLEEQLRCKVLIILDGNDIASGLGWGLMSKSVVFMQKAIYTSWLMQEYLEPWVHYIPIDHDLMDVEEKMKWVMEHDTEARHIAERGTLWIHDLLFHADADNDNDLIQTEMAHRYMAHFNLNTSDSILCPNGTVEPDDDDDDDDRP